MIYIRTKCCRYFIKKKKMCMNSRNDHYKLEKKIFPGIPARPPHNNYLFILLEVGFFGLFFWLLIFLCYFLDLRKTPFSLAGANFIKFLFPLIFLLACFSDEYLVRHNPTLLFSFICVIFCLKDFDLNSAFNSPKKPLQ